MFVVSNVIHQMNEYMKHACPTTFADNCIYLQLLFIGKCNISCCIVRIEFMQKHILQHTQSKVSRAKWFNKSFTLILDYFYVDLEVSFRDPRRSHFRTYTT